MEKIHILLISLTLTIFGILVIVSVFSPELFNETTITGHDVNTRVNVLPISSSDCNFSLSPGWNLVSFYCIGMFEPVDDTLSSIRDNYQSIFMYNAMDANDPWKSYNPSLPDWAVQQLQYLDRMSGYWIYMTGSSDFNFNGSKKYTVIPLRPGWNLVGYPNIHTQNINDSLNGVLFTVLKTYDTPSATYLVYINGSASNTLHTTDTYKGYWLNSTAFQNWNLNAS